MLALSRLVDGSISVKMCSNANNNNNNNKNRLKTKVPPGKLHEWGNSQLSRSQTRFFRPATFLFRCGVFIILLNLLYFTDHILNMIKRQHGLQLSNMPLDFCSENHFTCGDGTCIPIQWECDWYYDCNDYTDEHSNCPYTGKIFATLLFLDLKTHS